jgi:tetratricopeptide (TPR) repeat protein
MADGLKARLRAELAELLAVEPDNPQYVAARIGAGQRADLLGDHDQALARFREALSVDPDDPEARYEQGCQLLLSGHPLITSKIDIPGYYP